MIDLIAQTSPFADQPSEGIDFVLFLPLIVGAVGFGILAIVGRVLESLEHRIAPGVLDASFLVLLLLAGYSVVLVIVALVGEMALVADLAEVIAIVIVFFGLLIGLLLLAEQAIAAIARNRRMR